MKKESERFNSYRVCEGRTGIGQLIGFNCPHDVEPETVVEFLRTNIRDVSIPTTGRVKTTKDSCICGYTRYDIVQRWYGGGGHPGAGGYSEVLEIKNPPDGRCGIVIYDYISDTSYRGGSFTEWETLQDALTAIKKCGICNNREGKITALPGFKRFVSCGLLTPWFYAIGDEQLVGDYAFPDSLQDDPVFRFGRQFVVLGRDDVPTIKTCMGTRFVEKIEEWKFRSPRKEKVWSRIVYWDDGSVWDEYRDRDKTPRPAEEGEVWIAEAIQQFRQLLAGKTSEFAIDFTDGNAFIGKLRKKNTKALTTEGRYNLVVQIKGEEKPRKGVETFKPTPEMPDIVTYVVKCFSKKEKEVTRVEVKSRETEKGGKKWSGVFFSR